SSRTSTSSRCDGKFGRWRVSGADGIGPSAEVGRNVSLELLLSGAANVAGSLRERGPASGASRLLSMSEVTRILSAIEQGDPHASEGLLPLVYDELRKLAAQRLAQEKPGQTLQATALVHEAYVRLVGHEDDRGWDSRGHFFVAAAEAMRRILV